jgi:hypothetical protein
MKTLTLSIFAGDAAGSLVSVINIVPLPNQRFVSVELPLILLWTIMAKLLKVDKNKVISAIFEIICMDFHLTMIIGRSARHFKW